MLKRNSLKKLFEPKNIAIIGASDNQKKVGGIIFQKILKSDSKPIPVNPTHNYIEGYKCYHSVLEFSKKIDLAIIATPAKFVLNAVEECCRKKIKNLIIISSGFSEIGNKTLEKKILDLTKKEKINLLGPNCFGIVNTKINLDTTFARSSPKRGHTAFVSQSGALWSYIADLEKIGISKFISLGNMAGLTFAETIEYLNKDKDTKKIVLYVESLKKGREFIEACRNSKKEIVVVKSGRTKKGKEATMSHTGSLATNFKIYKSAFKQAKINVAFSLAEAFGLKKEELILDPKEKYMILTNAGGGGALLSDYLEEKNLQLIQQPIDILGTATAQDYGKYLDKLFDKKNFSTLLIILTPQSMAEPEETAYKIAQFKRYKKVITLFLGDKSVSNAKTILEKYGIPVFTQCL